MTFAFACWIEKLRGACVHGCATCASTCVSVLLRVRCVHECASMGVCACACVWVVCARVCVHMCPCMWTRVPRHMCRGHTGASAQASATPVGNGWRSHERPPREEPGGGHRRSARVCPAAAWPRPSSELTSLPEPARHPPQSGRGRPVSPAPTEPEDRAAQSQVLTSWQRAGLWPAGGTARARPAALLSGRHSPCLHPSARREKLAYCTLPAAAQAS